MKNRNKQRANRRLKEKEEALSKRNRYGMKDLTVYNAVQQIRSNGRAKQTVTIATVWAYFRQLSGDEIYRVTTQAAEEVMFRINYRSDITTSHVIKYKDTLYNITRVDVYEGYKKDLTLYCKKQ